MDRTSVVTGSRQRSYRRLVAAARCYVFHNPLTHTFKVAQVARRLAERLQTVHHVPDEDLNPDVAEAAAHAHDLGHPPFGHVAEQRLQELMRPSCGTDHFEGNAQSLRIVTTLASHDRNYLGLNLTRRTLDAILKYPWQAISTDESKWGAYESETGDFRFARDGKADSRDPSLEAAIMDWADDITYAVHDVEDLFRAGVAPMDRLRSDSEFRDEFSEWVHDRWKAKDKRLSLEDISTALRQVTTLVPFTRPYEGTSLDRVRLRSYSSALIDRYISRESALEVVGTAWSLSISPDARLEVDVLKELTWRFMIEGPALAAQQRRVLLNGVAHPRCLRASFLYLFVREPAVISRFASVVLLLGRSTRSFAVLVVVPPSRGRSATGEVCRWPIRRLVAQDPRG